MIDHQPSLHRSQRMRPYRAVCLSLTLACGVTGCKSSPSTTAPNDDASLSKAVQGRITGDTSLASEPIQVSVAQSIATLTGSVSSDAARSLAANDAAQVSGIKTVVNNLIVQAISSAASRANRPAPAPVRHDKPTAGVQPGQTRQQEQQPSERGAPIERAYSATPATTPPFLPPSVFRSITLPTDTTLPVGVNTLLDSATTQEGEVFTGSIASDVVMDGLVVLAQGTSVSGRVDTVHEAGHFKGSSLLSITLTGIDRRGGHLDITTDEFSKAGNGRGKNTAEKVGGGAAIGAILGGIIGGGKGAAIGAGVGGGAGAGVQGVTKGQQVQIPAETLVRFHLTSPVTVRVSTAERTRSDAATDDLQHHTQ